MTDQELEQRLKEAVAHAAPNDLDVLLSRCETRKGTVIPMKAKKTPMIRVLVAACLALVLIGGGGGLFYQQAYAVASVVSLDVNPSIELSVNQRETVLACTPLNDEAVEILSDMDGGRDLKGTKLDVAVNAIVGSLVRHGYLGSVSSAILISVEDKDQARAAQLQQELEVSVGSLLETNSANAAVLSQTLTQDAGLEQQARQHHISTGKAALVNQAIGLNSSLKFEDLAALSVEELKDLVEAGAPGMPIGKAEAAYLAQAYAGVLEVNSITYEVDPELDDSPAHYEVDLYTQAGEFEYKVDSYAGKILSGKANILAGAQESAGTSGTAPGSGDASQGRDRALAAALQHAGLKESQVSGLTVERDEDDGILSYDIEFRTSSAKYEYEVDGSGNVLKYEKEAFVPSSGSDIGREKAKSIALNHAGLKESQVTELKLDWEDNAYEVEFRSGSTDYEYKIDSSSGSILHYEQEQDD